MNQLHLEHHDLANWDIVVGLRNSSWLWLQTSYLWWLTSFSSLSGWAWSAPHSLDWLLYQCHIQYLSATHSLGSHLANMCGIYSYSLLSFLLASRWEMILQSLPCARSFLQLTQEVPKLLWITNHSYLLMSWYSWHWCRNHTRLHCVEVVSLLYAWKVSVQCIYWAEHSSFFSRTPPDSASALWSP